MAAPLIALTTRWNAHRHTSGEALIEEITGLGFDRVELGYDTRRDLVPGLRRMIDQKVVRVDSVHNFCPVPMAALKGHPETFTFSDPDRRIRELAVTHTGESIRFAAEIGARVVVTHCGNIEMPRFTPTLVDYCEAGRMHDPAYEKAKMRMMEKREKRAGRQIRYWYESIEHLLPMLEEYHITLAMENLPTWEAVPTEKELETLLDHFSSPWLMYWHDMGHGRIRENLGLINAERWLERLSHRLAGMHIHDVAPPAADHVMPPLGGINFSRYKRFAKLDIVRVIEPTPRTPAGEIREALAFLKQEWNDI